MKVSPLDKQLHRLTVIDSQRYADLRSSGQDDSLRELTDEQLNRAIGQLVEHSVLRVGPGATRVSVPAILQSYQRRGLDVASIEEIHELPIEDIDQVAGRLCFKYQAMAIGEGLGAGFAGLPGALVDIPALIGLSNRAVAEVATHYGFDVSSAFEQKFALLVLVLATGGGHNREQIQQALACGVGAGDDGQLNVRLRRQITESLVLRLMQEKLSHSVAMVGSLAAGAFNIDFVQHVCQTARTVYRERWLVDRYSTRLAAAE